MGIRCSHTRQVVPQNSTSVDDPNESLISENHHLKDRIDEFASNEKHLIEINEDLQRQIHDLARKDGSSSSSEEMFVSSSVHMEQIHSLTREIEKLRRDYGSLEEKYEYEKARTTDHHRTTTRRHRRFGQDQTAIYR